MPSSTEQVTAPDAFAAFVNLTTSRPPSSGGPPIYGIDAEFHGFVLQRYRQLLEGTNADMKTILGWRYQGEKLKWGACAAPAACFFNSFSISYLSIYPSIYYIHLCMGCWVQGLILGTV